MQSADRPLTGIIMMLGFCVIAPLGDAAVKILGGLVPLGLILLTRFGVQAIILAPFSLNRAALAPMRGPVLRLIALRTAMHILGIAMMVTALRYLELADAIAIAFVMPFILLFLGRFVLGESVGIRRIAAATLGFVGTLMVIQPSFAQVGWPALLPLGVALNFAAFMLVTRKIAKALCPMALQAVSGLMAVAVLAPLLIAHGTGALTLPFGIGALDTGAVDAGVTGPAPLRPADWALLISVGVMGTLAHLLMTWSLKYAPSATLAPMQYLELPFAVGFGWIIFGDLPDELASAGIVLIIAAGVYAVLREHAQDRQERQRQRQQSGKDPKDRLAA